jgi:alpha-ketoglutarate-dependent taurine dioxygenase
MSTDSTFNKFKAIKRKPVTVSTQSLVKESYLEPGLTLPLVIQPEIERLNPVIWAEGARQEIEAQLLKHGAILFRNFDIDSVEKFEQFAKTVSPTLIKYHERSSPRTEVGEAIYTSTDYPADQSIHFHNEQSYTPSWPLKIWFYCKTPAQQGGATPIADGRKVLNTLDPKIVERFKEKKVMYLRNYGDGMGLTWQTAYQTTNKSDVEEYCRKSSISFEWKDANRLRTRQIFETIVKHPRSGEEVWFEHTAFFHISSLAASVRDVLLAEFAEEDLPFNTYYGDGTPIELSVLEEIRAAYQQHAVASPWQKRDLLLIDNVLVSHSRRPFVGPREILVAMADLYHSRTQSFAASA